MEPFAVMLVLDKNSKRKGNTLVQKTGTSRYHAYLGIPDNDRAIKELVVRWTLV